MRSVDAMAERPGERYLDERKANVPFYAPLGIMEVKIQWNLFFRELADLAWSR